MTLDITLFRKKSKVLHSFDLSLFVYLLPSLTNKWPHTILWVFEEGAIEYILRAKIWLDGFDSVFWQVSIEFLFVFIFLFSYLLSFDYRSNMTLWVSREGVKWDRCPKIFFSF